jgi:hypothetical protein
VNLFNRRLIDLANYFVALSECNMTEQNANRAAIALDAMITNEILDYKSEPDINFIKLFEKYYGD